MPKADTGMYLNMPSKDDTDQTRDLNESEIFEADTQVVRSSSPWSAGFKIDVEAEHSILLAYRKIINESKRFIYIENQFFVSTSSLQQNTIQNEVSKYIAERIILAHMREEPYKVYIVLPEKSGFSGKLEERTAAEQELFFHLQMHSIYRGKNSIQAYLDDWNLKQAQTTLRQSEFKNSSNMSSKSIEINNYLTVGAFHKWEAKSNRVEHEAIYIHSKLLLADDEQCLIGSANINDRSLLGSRDSEVCIHIKSPKFCKSLRQRIWGCALGLSSYDKNASENEFDALGPPESDDFFKKVWMKTAADNSSHFWDAFRNLPSNHVLSYLNIHEPSYAKWFSEYQKTKTVSNSQKLEILKKTKGYLIMYQHGFAVSDTSIRTTKTSLDTFHSLNPVFL